MASTILDSASFRRVFVMQSEKSQIDFVSRYDTTLLQFENVQIYAVPLIGLLTKVAVYKNLQDFPGFKKVVSQVNP